MCICIAQKNSYILLNTTWQTGKESNERVSRPQHDARTHSVFFGPILSSMRFFSPPLIQTWIAVNPWTWKVSLLEEIVVLGNIKVWILKIEKLSKSAELFLYSCILPPFSPSCLSPFVFASLDLPPPSLSLHPPLIFNIFAVPSPSLPSAVLADNLKSNPGIKWQYFSSEEGIFTVFPAHKFQCKGSYEHRSRYGPAFGFLLSSSSNTQFLNR